MEIDKAGGELDNLIERFVITTSGEIELVKEILSVASKFVQVYQDGTVEIVKTDIGDKEKVFLVILSRYLAYKINELKGKEVVKSTEPTTTVEQIASILGKDPKAIAARLSELHKEGIVKKTSKGVYTIYSLSKALDYLKEISLKSNKVKEKYKNRGVRNEK
ncbi:MAG: helix-turn-helix domain-containing protein [Desulfurococcales archaeon]|nr:helix-turn-helix domain-containing protein [Desulfurococcales archaeon]